MRHYRQKCPKRCSGISLYMFRKFDRNIRRAALALHRHHSPINSGDVYGKTNFFVSSLQRESSWCFTRDNHAPGDLIRLFQAGCLTNSGICNDVISQHLFDNMLTDYLFSNFNKLFILQGVATLSIHISRLTAIKPPPDCAPHFSLHKASDPPPQTIHSSRC